eukprot:2322612-Prymnesium_polylepis.1
MRASARSHLYRSPVLHFRVNLGPRNLRFFVASRSTRGNHPYDYVHTVHTVPTPSATLAAQDTSIPHQGPWSHVLVQQWPHVLCASARTHSRRGSRLQRTSSIEYKQGEKDRQTKLVGKDATELLLVMRQHIMVCIDTVDVGSNILNRIGN